MRSNNRNGLTLLFLMLTISTFAWGADITDVPGLTGINGSSDTFVIKNDIDVSNVPDSLYGASETYGALYFSGGCGYTFGDDVAKTMPASIIAYLNERVYEDSEYKYEVYLEGELIKSDTIKAEATPFFRQISTEFELDRVTDKVYCIVLYDANGSENILGVIWHVEIDY